MKTAGYNVAHMVYENSNLVSSWGKETKYTTCNKEFTQNESISRHVASIHEKI